MARSCSTPLAAGLACAILIPRGNSYWNFSDGVYLYSANAVLHGQQLYTDFASAQPPPLYYVGAAILSVGDSAASFRTLLALVNVLTGLTVLIAVYRLTGRPYLAVISGALALLTPRALHDAANLLPETFAAPLVMSAAILASRRTTAAIGGAIAAVAVAFKLAFLLPRRTPRRRRRSASIPRRHARRRSRVGRRLPGGLRRLAAGRGHHRSARGRPHLPVVHLGRGPAGGLESPAVCRPGHRGLAPARVLAGSRPPAHALLGRSRVPGGVRHDDQVGAYINLAVVVEPPLLALSAAGVAWAWESRSAIKGIARVGTAVGALLLALGVAQAGGLLFSPSAPWPFARPGSSSTLGWKDSPSQVDAELARIARCPSRLAYSGPPYFAFLAHRRMPGGQGDPFITANAPINAGFLGRARHDRPRCPGERGR